MESQCFYEGMLNISSWSQTSAKCSHCLPSCGGVKVKAQMTSYLMDDKVSAYQLSSHLVQPFWTMYLAVLPTTYGGHLKDLNGARRQLCLQSAKRCQNWSHGSIWVSFNFCQSCMFLRRGQKSPKTWFFIVLKLCSNDVGN